MGKEKPSATRNGKVRRRIGAMQKTCLRNTTRWIRHEAPLVVSNTQQPGAVTLQRQPPPGHPCSSRIHSSRRHQPRWPLPRRLCAAPPSFRVIAPGAAAGITLSITITGEGKSARPATTATTTMASIGERSLLPPRATSTSSGTATIRPTATRVAAAAARAATAARATAATTTARRRTIDGSGNERIFRGNAGRPWYQASRRTTTGRALTSRNR